LLRFLKNLAFWLLYSALFPIQDQELFNRPVGLLQTGCGCLMSRLSKAVNASLAKFLPEQTLTLKTRVDKRELTFSPVVRLFLLSGTTLALGWLVIATTATISSSFESDNAQARSDSLQDAYELRLAELSAERDAFGLQTQAMQDRLRWHCNRFPRNKTN